MLNKAWQLEAQYFQIINNDWSLSALHNLKSRIVYELGLNKNWTNKISFKCLRLIFYEKSFVFKRYDEIEEKLLSNVFVLGKLIIILPSLYSGGEHYIQYSQEKHLFDFAHDANQYTHYVVYNASKNCKHEIQPVTKGYQVTLVYNIIIEKTSPSIPPIIYLNPDLSDMLLVQELDKLLSTWYQNKNLPSKLVIHLSAEYTRANISSLLLNKKDRSIASLFLKSIQQQYEVSKKNNILLYFGRLALEEEYERTYDEYTDNTVKISDLMPVFTAHNNDFPWCKLFNFDNNLDIIVSFDELMDEEAFFMHNMPNTTFTDMNRSTGNYILSNGYVGALLLIPYHLKWELFMDDLPRFYTVLAEIRKQIELNSSKINTLIFEECIELFHCLFKRKNPKFDLKEILKCLITLYCAQTTINISVMNLIKDLMKHEVFIEKLLELPNEMYELGNSLTWINISLPFHEAFRSTLMTTTILHAAKFLISLLQLSSDDDTTLSFLILCMTNELLLFAFKKRFSVTPLTVTQLCWLLHLLILCHNEYLSSIKLITSSIIKTLRCSSNTNVVNGVIQSLIPFLLKIQSYHSNENAQECFFILHEQCLSALNCYYCESIPPIIFQKSNIDCDCNDCKVLMLFLCDVKHSIQQFSIDKQRCSNFYKIIEEQESLSCVYEHLSDGNGQLLLVMKSSDYENERQTCLMLREVLLNMIEPKSNNVQEKLFADYHTISSAKRFKLSK
ncbi:unnamed protein product [Didymodactylos carnosus]|uniref:Prolyl 4-hydroxylase alpha subunit Fe(2+) 2OG dioxygenase domain-containing protein n=1 Tax=Didymodactylos carnosus TaxID=1234261 RepID=A0A815MJR6_9BILA|nr:unnamed protein product [Didymodactylos carnosus]CAF1423903.1 unnamed protein product [Didymodactylos carnosus]CAF4129616.1 unnamed protein product [Didymodactylos carnosus]CAF4305704.1 unnamed protein product [Didymodactylos carnosus]